jgi:hypothetical protein
MIVTKSFFKCQEVFSKLFFSRILWQYVSSRPDPTRKSRIPSKKRRATKGVGHGKIKGKFCAMNDSTRVYLLKEARLIQQEKAEKITRAKLKKV